MWPPPCRRSSCEPSMQSTWPRQHDSDPTSARSLPTTNGWPPQRGQWASRCPRRPDKRDPTTQSDGTPRIHKQAATTPYSLVWAGRPRSTEDPRGRVSTAPAFEHSCVDAARVKPFVKPLPVGAVELLSGERVEADAAEFGVDALDLEPVTSHGRGRTGRSE